jgi:hypothetical protein
MVMMDERYEKIKRKAIELAILIAGIIAGMSIDTL